MRPCEREQDKADPDPTYAGKRERRDVACDVAGEHDVAGPKQRSQAEQQIGLVADPAERRVVFRFCGQAERICAGKSCAGKAVEWIGGMRWGTQVGTEAKRFAERKLRTARSPANAGVTRWRPLFFTPQRAGVAAAV